MSELFRRSCAGVTLLHLRPRTSQQSMQPVSFTVCRQSMSTKQHKGPQKEDELDPRLRLPVIRPSFLYSQKGRADCALIEERYSRRRQKLWADLKRAEAELPAGDVLQRRRALERIYADLVVANALGLLFSSNRVRQFCEETDPRGFIRWWEEERELQKTLFLARVRSANLWICAPMNDVGLLRRLGRLISFIVSLPLFVGGRLLTAQLPFLRWAHRRNVHYAALSKSQSTKPKGKNRE